MRRWVSILTLVVGGALASGCGSTASTSQAGDASQLTTVTDAGGGHSAVAASGLVFDPPVALGEPAIYLARAPRQPSAFFGYDEGSIEYYRLTVDDTQSFGGTSGRYYAPGGTWCGGGGSGWSDRYERRAVSERVGAIRR